VAFPITQNQVLQKMKPGKFITVEGIDGAGKSSHLAAISQFLRDRDIRVLETREPGGTPLGERLRDLILHEPMSGMTELLAIFAARAEHLAHLIRPALARGDWVVCDRFTDSTRAYQGGGRGLDTAVIEQLADCVHADCNPDLTLIFDIDLATAAARVQGRTQMLDKFETETQSFSRKVQAAYRHIAATQAHRCTLINGGQSIEAVRGDVLAVLQDKLGL
jgi:dTMP kinase